MSLDKAKTIIEKQPLKDIFLKKLQLCSITLDYSDDQKDIKAKSDRILAIQELKDFLNDPKSITQYFIPNIEQVFEMIQKNLFRPLIPFKKSGEKLELSETGKEEDDNSLDPSWPHLQGIYEIFLKLTIHESVDVKSLKIIITPSFVHNLLELFNSEDAREREYLKSVLYRLYGKLIPRRRVIRKAINESLLSMIHENKKYNGANELLEILSSMISGFGVPLREEHVNFFNNIIIPLHKVHYSHYFHEQLQRCSGLFLSKDQTLSENLLLGLLRYWPYGNSQKEILFLDELSSILEFYDPGKLDIIINQVLRRIFMCMSSPHLQVSDRSMSFFEKEYFLNIIKSYKDIAFPLFVPTVVEFSETHWFKILQESFASVKLILKEIDFQLFEKFISERANAAYNPLVRMHNVPQRIESEAKWELLIKEAKKIEPGFEVPEVPYKETHVVGLNNRNGENIHSNNLIPFN